MTPPVPPFPDRLGEQDRQEDDERAQKGLRVESAPPVRDLQEQCAQHRRGDRGDHGNGLDGGDRFFQPLPLVHVLDDRCRRGGSGGCAGCLQDARGDQHGDVRGERAEQAGCRIDRQPQEQDRPAAVLVGEGSPDERRNAVNRKKQDDGEVCQDLGNIEVLRHRRQRREIEIGRQRDERAQKDEKENKALIPEDLLPHGRAYCYLIQCIDSKSTLLF